MLAAAGPAVRTLGEAPLPLSGEEERSMGLLRLPAKRSPDDVDDVDFEAGPGMSHASQDLGVRHLGHPPVPKRLRGAEPHAVYDMVVNAVERPMLEVVMQRAEGNHLTLLGFFYSGGAPAARSRRNEVVIARLRAS